ncbi:hypothetical protein Gohar_007452 [Gossypium harknessii]|uniref:Uncharacterized protein n=1 Tax=Gossypium harknessii TaxID=34285 RepID=A0A7J9GH76_9ROSI|nr:hypothetical protein [Gossypium harknessii]
MSSRNVKVLIMINRSLEQSSEIFKTKKTVSRRLSLFLSQKQKISTLMLLQRRP